MNNKHPIRILLCLFVLASLVAPIFAQKRGKSIIYGVVNDGALIEPIAFIENGKLTEAVGGDSDPKDLAAFVKNYYKPKTAYRLIFGGATAGTVTVKNANAKSDCAKNMADVTIQSTKVKIGGFVMALATDLVSKSAASGLRRKPTAAEKAEIDKLVRAELTAQNVSAAAQKNLHYHNLTVLDVDNDKKPEMVGSYWVETGAEERALLFFIAGQNARGKYEFGYSSFSTLKKEEVMSQDFKDVDTTGLDHELLLDVFDIDNDGVAEIFTYSPGFEGAGFYAYRRENGKWTRVFEGSNYHCAY
ncbi:MAG: hypothetical protein JSS81_28265 [Acidobacteria bacterium]|nr:hypothetical protein [Acidobacteriota bacterium]